MSQSIAASELAKHKNDDSLWVAIDGGVYDVTKFVDEHPGGAKILKRSAGKDASKSFWKYHGEQVLKKYGPKLKVGEISESAKL